MVLIFSHVQNKKLQRISSLLNSIELLSQLFVPLVKVINILDKLTSHLVLLKLIGVLLTHLHHLLLDLKRVNLFVLKQIIHGLLGLIPKPVIQLPTLESHFSSLLKSHLFDPLSLTPDIFLVVNLEIIFNEILVLDLHPDLLLWLHDFLLDLIQPGDLSLPGHLNILQRVLAIHKIYKKYKNLSLCD
jgi:hypothetical protein